MIGLSKKKGKTLFSGVMLYLLSLFVMIGDILIRLSNGDDAGVLDIYPTIFIVVYAAVLIFIGIMNSLYYFGRRKDGDKKSDN